MEASKIDSDMQTKSKSFTDRFCLWTHHLIGTGKHGDLVRFLMGGGSVSKQIEYMKEHGSANPVLQAAAAIEAIASLSDSTSSASNPVASTHAPIESELDGGSSEDLQGDEAYENDPLPQQLPAEPAPMA